MLKFFVYVNLWKVFQVWYSDKHFVSPDNQQPIWEQKEKCVKNFRTFTLPVFCFQFTRDSTNEEALSNFQQIEPLRQDIANAKILHERQDYQGAIMLLSKAIEVSSLEYSTPFPQTESRPWSGSKPLFRWCSWKQFWKGKNNFEKKSADDNKSMKNYPACKELNIN